MEANESVKQPEVVAPPSPEHTLIGNIAVNALDEEVQSEHFFERYRILARLYAHRHQSERLLTGVFVGHDDQLYVGIFRHNRSFLTERRRASEAGAKGGRPNRIEDTQVPDEIPPQPQVSGGKSIPIPGQRQASFNPLVPRFNQPIRSRFGRRYQHR